MVQIANKGTQSRQPAHCTSKVAYLPMRALDTLEGRLRDNALDIVGLALRLMNLTTRAVLIKPCHTSVPSCVTIALGDKEMTVLTMRSSFNCEKNYSPFQQPGEFLLANSSW